MLIDLMKQRVRSGCLGPVGHKGLFMKSFHEDNPYSVVKDNTKMVFQIISATQNSHLAD